MIRDFSSEQKGPELLVLEHVADLLQGLEVGALELVEDLTPSVLGRLVGVGRHVHIQGGADGADHLFQFTLVVLVERLERFAGRACFNAA